MEPLYFAVVGKPRHLLLGVVARVLLYLFQGKRQLPFAVEVSEELLVADRIQRILLPERIESAHLVEQAILHHHVHAPVDSLKEFLTLAAQPNLDDTERTRLALLGQERRIGSA